MTNLPDIVATEAEKRNALYSALHHMRRNNDLEFYGSVLQCMNINYSEMVPTAGVYYDTKIKMFNVKINPVFFCKVLDNTDARIAVMIHEILHVTHKHVFFDTPSHINKQQLNFAMDLVINQYIKNLPEMCLKIENFRDKNGNMFPANKPTETYYELLNGAEAKVPNEYGEGEGEGDASDSNGTGKPQNGTPDSAGKGHKWVPVNFDKQFDQHGWDGAEGEGLDPKEKLEAAKDLFKRAIEKSTHGHSNIPDSIKDLMRELDARIQGLDMKGLLKRALKQTVPAKDIKKTWKRPSRRLGIVAPGNTQAMLPNVHFYMDTSGSISHVELNECIQVVLSVFNAGVNKIKLYKFHTAIYSTEVIKKGYTIQEKECESGGTDLQPVVDMIVKNRADINIVFTDGYYGEVSQTKIPQTVFIISKNGSVDHPLKGLGVTVKCA